MRLSDQIRLLAATARVTRLVTVDDVPGQWWVKDPIDAAMDRYQQENTRLVFPQKLGGQFTPHGVTAGDVFEEPWWWKYRDVLDCPHCFGLHAAFWMLTFEQLSKHAPKPVRALWKLATSALAVSWVVGHAEAYLSGGGDE